MDSEVKSESSTTLNEDDEEMKIFNILQQPPIAENIFRHLPAADLSTCAEICRSWNIVATSIKKKRRQIYAMSILEGDEGRNVPCFAPEKFLNLWSESNLAIAIGYSDDYRNLAIAIRKFCQSNFEESEAELSYWKEQYYRSIQEAKRRNKLFRNYLPRNCTFVNINLPVREHFLDEHNPPWLIPSEDSSRLILMPLTPGLEIQPFIIPPADDTSFPDRKTIELLHVSSGKNFLINDIKCMLVFANLTERDIEKKTTYSETSIAEYISEETIIIGGHSSLCPISTGIAISGKNVRIEFFCIEDSLCCVKYCFSVIKEIGLHNENGIAFLLKKCHMLGVILRSLWSEYFPKIVLTSVHLNSDLITSTMPSSVSSFHPCNVCGKVSNICDPLDQKLVLVFICFKDSNCKVIDV